MEIILLLLFFYGAYLFDSKVNGGAYSGSFDGMPHTFNPNAKIPNSKTTNKKEGFGNWIFTLIGVFLTTILIFVIIIGLVCIIAL